MPMLPSVVSPVEMLVRLVCRPVTPVEMVLIEVVRPCTAWLMLEKPVDSVPSVVDIPPSVVCIVLSAAVSGLTTVAVEVTVAVETAVVTVVVTVVVVTLWVVPDAL